jgi:hypothetical protein
VPVTLDELAANLDPAYEGFKGGQRHRAARYLSALPRECLVELWSFDAVQRDQLPGDDAGVASHRFGGAGKAIGYAG